MPSELHIKHLVYVTIFHFTTLLGLVFYIGIAYNRLAVVETRSMDNTAAIRIILETGTPLTRLQYETLQERLKDMTNRLEIIEHQTR